MSLFCLPITSTKLIYHLVARLQGLFHHQCFPGFSNPCNICISHYFAPCVSSCIHWNWIPFYQFLLLSFPFSGSFILPSQMKPLRHISTKPLSSLIHCHVLDEQQPCIIVSIIVVQPPYTHRKQFRPLGTYHTYRYSTRLFPSKGVHECVPWSIFSAKP